MKSSLAHLLAAAALCAGLARATPTRAPLQQQRDTPAVSASGPVVTVSSSGTYLRVGAFTYANGTSALIGGYADTITTADDDDGNTTSTKILQVVRSLDNGSSWTAPVGSVATGDAATRELDNPFPLQLVAGGRLVYAYRNHDLDADGQYAYYRISVSYSDDYGASWQFLSQVVERAAAASGEKNGVWEPFLRLAGDGTTLQCYYSSENADDDQDNLMQSSTDGGATWSAPVAVSGRGVASRDGMTGVAVVAGATLICVFENTQDGAFSIRYVLSYDDGATWDASTRALLYDPPAAASTAQAPAVVNVGGTLVASFMTNEDAPQDTDGDADGAAFKVLTASSDDPSAWAAETTIATGAHWPGLYALGDASFLALYGSDSVGVASRAYSV